MADMPWAQIITALAAIGGASTVGLFSRSNQRVQFEQQERVRYHERRIDTYAQFVSAGDALVAEVTSRPEFTESGTTLQARFEELHVQVELLLSPPVRKAGDEYFIAASQSGIAFRLFFGKERAAKDPEMQAEGSRMMDYDYALYENHRAEFVEAARQERGLPPTKTNRHQSKTT